MGLKLGLGLGLRLGVGSILISELLRTEKVYYQDQDLTSIKI